MKTEHSTDDLGLEFYLLRFYMVPVCWHLALCEVVNHDNGTTRALLTISRGYNGWSLTWCR